MTNDIETVSDYFSVTFEPSKLSIDNFDELKTQIENYSKKYKKLVATDESLAGAKSARTELNKLIKDIDGKRKDVKKVYNKPYDDFKNNIDELQEVLKNTVDPISEQINKIEDQQRSEREDKVKELINKMAPEYNVDPENISIEHSWTNKTMTQIKLTKILKDGFTAIKNKQDILAANKKLIDEHCRLKNIDSAGWISQVNEETNINDLMLKIDKSVDEKNRREQEAQNHQAYEQAIKEASQTKVANKTIDSDTGEIINDDAPSKYVMTFEVTGKLLDLKEVYRFIDSKNLKYSVIKDPIEVGD